jgi:hypothetical protein
MEHQRAQYWYMSYRRGDIFVKKILSCIIVATVSVSIRCSEQWAVVGVGMQPIVRKLTPIESPEELKEFTGKFVAYKVKPCSYYKNLPTDNTKDWDYGYLSPEYRVIKSDLVIENEECILSELLSKDQPKNPTSRELSQGFFAKNSIVMRKVTPAEMIAIIRGLNEEKARLGHFNPFCEQENMDRLKHPSTLDLMNAVYCGQYSQLLESPASREFSELWCCIKQQYSNVPKELRKYTLGYLGLLKLQGCVEY